MDVAAFRGYRYDPAVVGDPALCIAPPYDVIDPAQQEALHAQSPYNIVRVIKGFSQADDDDERNVYSRAGQTLRDWTAAGVLKQDAAEAIYICVQEFTLAGRAYRRMGFIALGRSSGSDNAVKPHEHVIEQAMMDRLNLLRATHSHLGQVFVLYSDPDCVIDSILEKAIDGPELLRHTDENAVTHKLYSTTDADDIARIVDIMGEKHVLIADGHHRYETAMRYYAETNDPAAAHCMMTFVNMHNDGLVVLATHRLIKNVVDFDAAELLRRLDKDFEIQRFAFGDPAEEQSQRQCMAAAMQDICRGGQHAFGMYLGDGAFYLATLRDLRSTETLGGGRSSAWRRLDVTVLHSLVLEQHLNIDAEALKAQRNVEYVKDLGDAATKAIDKVDGGLCQGLFILSAPSVGQIEAVAKADEKMPQKSTFFYPKVYSGLVINVTG